MGYGSRFLDRVFRMDQRSGLSERVIEVGYQCGLADWVIRLGYQSWLLKWVIGVISRRFLRVGFSERGLQHAYRRAGRSWACRLTVHLSPDGEVQCREQSTATQKLPESQSIRMRPPSLGATQYQRPMGRYAIITPPAPVMPLGWGGVGLVKYCDFSRMGLIVQDGHALLLTQTLADRELNPLRPAAALASS